MLITVWEINSKTASEYQSWRLGQEAICSMCSGVEGSIREAQFLKVASPPRQDEHWGKSTGTKVSPDG